MLLIDKLTDPHYTTQIWFILFYFSGLNQILKLKTKTSNIQTRTRESSLSWSESISSLSQINSSRTSQLSLMNSDSDCSSTNSSSFMLKKPKQFRWVASCSLSEWFIFQSIITVLFLYKLKFTLIVLKSLLQIPAS